MLSSHPYPNLSYTEQVDYIACKREREVLRLVMFLRLNIGYTLRATPPPPPPPPHTAATTEPSSLEDNGEVSGVCNLRLCDTRHSLVKDNMPRQTKPSSLPLPEDKLHRYENRDILNLLIKKKKFYTKVFRLCNKYIFGISLSKQKCKSLQPLNCPTMDMSSLWALSGLFFSRTTTFLKEMMIKKKNLCS